MKKFLGKLLGARWRTHKHEDNWGRFFQTASPSPSALEKRFLPLSSAGGGRLQRRGLGQLGHPTLFLPNFAEVLYQHPEIEQADLFIAV